MVAEDDVFSTKGFKFKKGMQRYTCVFFLPVKLTV